MERTGLKQKLIILGPTNSGKTCFLEKLLYDKFSENSTSTIGVSFGTVPLPGTNIQLNVWDTAGGPEYKHIIELYLRGLEAAIITLACDSIHEDNYEVVQEYLENITTEIRSHKNDNTYLDGIPDHTVPILLVLTKIDLIENLDDHVRIQKFCDTLVERYRLWGCVEISSKSMNKAEVIDRLYAYARNVQIKTINSTSLRVLPATVVPDTLAKKCCILQ